MLFGGNKHNNPAIGGQYNESSRRQAAADSISHPFLTTKPDTHSCTAASIYLPADERQPHWNSLGGHTARGTRPLVYDGLHNMRIHHIPVKARMYVSTAAVEEEFTGSFHISTAQVFDDFVDHINDVGSQTFQNEFSIFG